MKKLAKAEDKLIPELNIGLVGHIDHGKTTLTKALTGKWTDTHSEELKRGITIKLGYADVTFYKCKKCDEPQCYTTEQKCPECGGKCDVLRTASFVDAPGHEALMTTMLSGAAIMDGAILVVAANEKCPQPQTREHATALKIAGIENVVAVQNKVDLVSEEEAEENRKELELFLKSMGFDVPIIPISAHHSINVDYLIKAIGEFIPTPEREKGAPKMLVARSFDVNLPGISFKELEGGVLGGSVVSGTFSVGDEIEIRPGMREGDKNVVWDPVKTEIVSIVAGRQKVDKATPGGSVGIGTLLDPNLTKSDSLSGQVVGLPGKLPETRDELSLEPHLLERVVGTEEEGRVEPIKVGEPLLVNVGSGVSSGVVKERKKKQATLSLKIPVCVEEGSRVAISRRVGNRWRLIGYGLVV